MSLLSRRYVPDSQQSRFSLISKQDWWNKGIMQGPIIEQGTHIADLSRYFGGDIDVDTITYVLTGHRTLDLGSLAEHLTGLTPSRRTRSPAN